MTNNVGHLLRCFCPFIDLFCEHESHSVMSNSLRPHGLYSPWNSLGQNIGVGILPNPGLLHCRRILYQLSHKGSPEILECVTYPFSSGSSRPRNWSGVSCIAGGFFINWAIREALFIAYNSIMSKTQCTS